jgi:HEAT repeat protein
MCQIKKPLPVEALMAILADRETTSVYLRMEVASTLAFVKAEESLDPVLRLIQDPDEEVCLREMLVESLATWGERISDETLLALLANSEPAICAAALHVWGAHPSQTIPIATVLPYCIHEAWYVCEAAIKTLLATEDRVPIDAILMTMCAMRLPMAAFNWWNASGIRSHSNRSCKR